MKLDLSLSLGGSPPRAGGDDPTPPAGYSIFQVKQDDDSYVDFEVRQQTDTYKLLAVKD